LGVIGGRSHVGRRVGRRAVALTVRRCKTTAHQRPSTSLAVIVAVCTSLAIVIAGHTESHALIVKA